MRFRYLLYAAAFAITCLASGPVLAQWTTYQADARHDGYVPLSLDPATLSMLWQRSLGTGTVNPVTAANGEVFVSIPGYFSSGMGLQALDGATGDTKWSKDYGSVFSVNPPAYANGRVYIQTCNHTPGTYLWAYDANTGELVYQAPTAAQWESYYAPTIYDNTVYINGGYYGGMYAIDGSSGQQKWFVGLNQYDEWTPAVDENYAYAYTGDYGPSLTVVNRLTGQTAFTIKDPGFDWSGWSMYEAVALGAYNDAFGINANRLICFDLENKNIKWQTTRSFGYSGQATVAMGVVYAVDGGKLDAIDEETGDLLWDWTPPSGSLTGTVIATDTHVLASTSAATYAVDLNSHTAAWSYPVGGKLALSNRALYIAASNGTLTAIAVPPSAIFPVPPTAVSIDVLNPKTNPAYVSSKSISISGTADELDSSGAVLGTGCLSSVTWSNDRGGSGTGFYDSSWNTPTAWSVSDIALQPGDNVITITATDLWGNSDEATITLTAPIDLSIAITDPTSEPTYVTSTTPITLSGTAGSMYPSGTVSATAALVELTWSNDRGGSGTGTFSGPADAPTTWSAEGIAVQPGDNVITVAAKDLWGNTDTAVITVTAPVGLSIEVTDPTDEPAYTTNAAPITLSGKAGSMYPSGTVSATAALVELTWSNNRGGSGTGTFSGPSAVPTTWSAKDIGLQGGDNIITITATDLWGNTATDVITVTWTPASIGAAKKLPSGSLVYIQNVVVTATTIPSAGAFVESPDRSSGIRLVTNQPLNVGDQVSFSGAVGRVNGEYQISGVSFVSINSGNPLPPLFFTSKCIGNDRTESLNYFGLNTTGLLVRTEGRVTGTISTQQIFYLDDGGGYEDGVLPVYGLRVHVPSGVAIPTVNKWVAITGISRVERVVLNGWGEVNGDWYPAGTTLYIPSIWVRNAGDIQILSRTP